MHNTIAHHLLADAQPVPSQQVGSLLGNFHNLYPGNDVLWYGISLWAQVSSPGHVASQLLVQLLTGGVWDMENPSLRVRMTAGTKIWVSYQHYPHPKSGKNTAV